MRQEKIRKRRVLVVGAGLAGLAVSRFLDPKLFDVEVIEAKPKFHRLGYALILMPPGVMALRKLGFTRKEITRIGQPFNENHLQDEGGQLVLKNDFRKITVGSATSGA